MPLTTTTPDFGIDPALLVQPAPQPSPMDAVGAALAALQASGAVVGPLQPSLYSTGHEDTNLIDPTLPDPNTTAQPARLPAGVPSAQYDAQGRQIHGHVLPEGSVTVSHQQPLAGPREVAQQLRQSNLNDPSVPLASNDVAGYDYREQAAVGDARDAHVTAEQAKIRAEQEKAEKMAQVEEDHAMELQLADGLYKRQKAALQTQADAETAAWVTEYQNKAQQEPNPDRWWDNRSALGKALWALGMVFGAAHAAITPGAQNVALQMAAQEIDRDVALQKQRLAQEMDALKMKGTLMEKKQARLLTDAADDHSMKMGRLQALKQAYLQRAAAPGNAAMQAGIAAADAWFSEQEMRIAGSKREQAVQVREAELGRNHSSYLASLTDKRDRDLALMADKRARDLGAAEIAKDYDLARMAADTAKAKAAGQSDVRGVSKALGAKMVGSPLGDTIQVPKDTHEKMTAVFKSGARRYKNLNVVKGELAKNDAVDRLVAGDPKLAAAAQELGYTLGRQMNGSGALSDADVQAGMKASFGFDPISGKIVDKLRFEKNLPVIKEMVDNEMRSLPEEVSVEASQFLDANHVGDGARILWTPPDMDVEKPETKNASQVLQGAGLLERPTAPANAKEFDERLAKEKADPMFKGTALPAYDEGKVAEFTEATKGMEPDLIRRLATKTLKDYGDNKDPWAGAVDDRALTTRAAIQSAAEKAEKASEAKVKELVAAAQTVGTVYRLRGDRAPTRDEITEMATKDIGLGQAPKAVDAAVEAALKAYEGAGSWKRRK